MFLRRGGKAMKKFYKENRVFVILMGIALVCIAIIIAIFAIYIINSSATDKYGNRLDGIEDVKITEEKVGEMEEGILAMSKVKDVSINIDGKTVKFIIDFENDASIEERQNVAISSLEFFEENYLNFYDMQFMMTKTGAEESSKDNSIFGARKSGASTISWSNNIKN